MKFTLSEKLWLVLAVAALVWSLVALWLSW